MAKEKRSGGQLVKIDHLSVQNITYKDLESIDPELITFDKIHYFASKIRKYLSEQKEDPYIICVHARSAMNVITECLKIMYKMNSYFKNQYKKEYSIAKLERAEDWFKENKPEIKLTDGMRSTYAEMDEKYLDIKNKYDTTFALLEYLKNKRDDFEHDLNLAKKQIADNELESRKAKYTNPRDEDYETI